jgi:tetratricopeptide (TPR) repeat protein
VRLFVDRAQAVRPDFQLTRTNAAAIAALCSALEGLPLALELAAARTGVLTPQQMLDRLQQRFDLLAGGRRGTDPRHRSLRATLEWSYQLLFPELQRFFTRLSVFRGGWTLDAAQTICDEPRTLAYLDELRHCSLVETESVGETMRFRLLESLREYGAEQLDSEEHAAVAHLHASYYLALAERAEPELLRMEQALWLDRLERDLDNLRIALAWWETSGFVQEALRLGGALWRFWHVRGHHREGQERLMRLLTRSGSSWSGDPDAALWRARALNGASLLAWYLGGYETTRRLAEEGLAIGRELNDQPTIRFALTNLGFVAHGRSDFEAARVLFEEALTIARQIGDLWSIADLLNDLGELARNQSDIETARTLVEESLRLFRELGDQGGIAVSLRDLGLMALADGAVGRARTLLEESLAVRRKLGDRRGVANTLCWLGKVADGQGDCNAARALYEQGLQLCQQTGDRRGVADALGNQAELALREGDRELARTLLREISSIWQELGNWSASARALDLLARTEG